MNLPHEVLLEEVLPKLPLGVMGRLCSTCLELRGLFQSEVLWQNRTKREFPEQQYRPELWSEYYKLLITGRAIPLYHHGDKIGKVPFHLDFLNLVISVIGSYISERRAYIVFIDAARRPIISVSYPSKEISILSRQFDTIEKVFFSYNTFHDDPATIYSEMVSQEGHPPIYGISYYIEAFRYTYLFTLDVKNDNRYQFHIIDSRRTDQKMCALPQRSSNLSVEYCAELVKELGLFTEGLDQDELCFLIHQKLEEIGHII